MEWILKMAINFRKALEALGTFSGEKMWGSYIRQKNVLCYFESNAYGDIWISADPVSVPSIMSLWVVCRKVLIGFLGRQWEGKGRYYETLGGLGVELTVCMLT